MYACLTKLEPDFSRGGAGKRMGYLLFATHPRPSIRELTSTHLDEQGGG